MRHHQFRLFVDSIVTSDREIKPDLELAERIVEQTKHICYLVMSESGRRIPQIEKSLYPDEIRKMSQEKITNYYSQLQTQVYFEGTEKEFTEWLVSPTDRNQLNQGFAPLEKIVIRNGEHFANVVNTYTSDYGQNKKKGLNCKLVSEPDQLSKFTVYVRFTEK